MSLQHFRSLLLKSTLIQQAIDQEHQRRWPNWIRLLKLKKLRLAIKDRLSRLAYTRPIPALQPARVKIRVRNGTNFKTFN